MKRTYKIKSATKIHPGVVATLVLEGAETFEAGSGIEGYPETRIKRISSVEKPFTITSIETDPDVEKCFSIIQVYAGNCHTWTVNDNGVPCRILNQKPKIPFHTIQPELLLTLQVKNTSDKPRQFVARLVGDEQQTLEAVG